MYNPPVEYVASSQGILWFPSPYSSSMDIYQFAIWKHTLLRPGDIYNLVINFMRTNILITPNR